MASTVKVSLVPTEHGAYVQLVLALGAGLLMGDGRTRAWGQAALTGLLFLASAPTLVRLERRASEPTARRALGLLIVYGLLALLYGGIAWHGAAPELACSLVIPAALAGGVGALAFTGRLHTILGELVASWALASAAYPVAILGGANPRSALLLALALAGIQSIGTTTVRAFLESLRRKGQPLPRAIPPILGLLLAILGLAAPVPKVLPLSLAPSLAVAVWVLAAPPFPRHMKRLGWLLTAASAAGLLPLVLLLPK